MYNHYRYCKYFLRWCVFIWAAVTPFRWYHGTDVLHTCRVLVSVQVFHCWFVDLSEILHTALPRNFWLKYFSMIYSYWQRYLQKSVFLYLSLPPPLKLDTPCWRHLEHLENIVFICLRIFHILPESIYMHFCLITD